MKHDKKDKLQKLLQKTNATMKNIERDLCLKREKARKIKQFSFSSGR